MGTSRKQYLARIQRVQDHIENNLNEALTLPDLARVAAFSPYHFHRIFSAITGETPSKFVLRLRLERAASMLSHRPDVPVTNIALDNGFGDSAVFARAFRRQFGMSATDWRNRKDRKADGKDGHAASGGPSYDGGMTNPNASSSVTPTDVRVEAVETQTAAYVRHIGPYAADGALFESLFGQLMTWAGPRGLMQPPTTKMLTVYHDDPAVTDPDKLRISVGITVPAETAGSDTVGIMTLPPGQCVFARFELGVADYGAAWNWLYGTWLPDSGYQPDDRPGYELYLNNPEEHPEGKHIVELVVPVRPL